MVRELGSERRETVRSLSIAGERNLKGAAPSTRGPEWTNRWCTNYPAKGTVGITGLSPPRVHIDGEVWHLDVGSSHPGAVVGPKGWAVRPLKRHASWVQNVVRQFGPYPSRAKET